MAILCVLCFYSYSSFEPANFDENLFTNGATGFLESIGFVFMGYAGLTKICALASEIKEPEKNMPRAVLFSLGVFTPFFMLVVMACLANIEYGALKKDYAPLHTLAVAVGGEGFGYFVGLLCILTMASMANVCLAVAVG